MNNEYIIQGKHLNGTWYLYRLVGYSLEHAKTVLDEVISNPARYSPKYKLYSEFRILEVESKNCWWNQGTLD